MPAETREQLIERLESAIAKSVGVRLTAGEVRLLMARPEPSEPVRSPSPGVSCGAPSIDVQIRWLIRRDMPDVLRIEQQSFEHPWTEDDFLHHLRQRNCIGMVATHGSADVPAHEHEIVGSMIYELHKSHLHILNFAVAPAFQRKQVGRQMVARLIDKLHQQRRTRLQLVVRESNLIGQQFFKACGFRAVGMVDAPDGWDEDGIEMRYEIRERVHHGA